METGMKYYQVENVSEIGNTTKYLRLFRITGVTGRLSMLVVTGHNNIYAKESLDINSDINLFQCSSYASEAELQMQQSMEWKMIWSNIRLHGKVSKIVIGYEVVDGERQYGIYLTRLCGCKIFLHEEYLGYQSQHNYYFDTKEVDASDITIIKGEAYQDNYSNSVLPVCAVSNINPVTQNPNGSFLFEYSLYLYNTDHFNISFLKDIGYVSSITDADGTSINYDGSKGGYQIGNCKMPIKLQFYCINRKLNSIKDNYYFGIIVDSQYVKLVPIPISDITYVSNIKDIDTYGYNSGFIAIPTESPRMIFYAGKNNSKKKLLTLGTHYCPTTDRPSDAIKGECILDETLDKIIWFDGSKWIDSSGNPADAKNTGSSSERPTNIKIGFIFKDTTLNKLIIWNGTSWVNMDGTALS